MNSSETVPGKIIRTLGVRAPLGDGDRRAILALPYVLRTHEPMAYIVREGEPPGKRCSFVVSGLAFRQKLTTEGARQIVSIHMAGEFLDLQHLFLDIADHNVQALTRIEAAEVDRAALQALVLERPVIARAMWVDALVDASIFREWIVNIGRRTARARLAHLLCEFALRLEAAGLAPLHCYELPMTQEQLGDALGLTPVHVNRTLKFLAEEGLIQRDKRYIRFADWDGIRAAGDFSARYLHLGQTAPLML